MTLYLLITPLALAWLVTLVFAAVDVYPFVTLWLSAKTRSRANRK